MELHEVYTRWRVSQHELARLVGRTYEGRHTLSRRLNLRGENPERRIVLASALGALSVAAGNARGLPSLPSSAQQESGALGIDSLDFTVTRTGTAAGETNDSVTLVQDKSFPSPDLRRRNITLAEHDWDTDTGESALTGSEPP